MIIGERAKDIEQVVAEIQRQKESKRDYVYPANQIKFNQRGEIALQGTKLFKVGDRIYTEWKDAEVAADVSGEQLVPLEGEGSLPISKNAEQQLAGKLGIPFTYVQKLRQSEHPDIISYNFSELLARDNRKFLIRTLDGKVRAVLSNKYCILDNSDLFFLAHETFEQVGATIWNARLWDDGFELFALSPNISGNVDVQRDGAGPAWDAQWRGGQGDVHNAAIRIRNSETGSSSLSVSQAIFRSSCRNLLIFGDEISVIHLGRQKGEGIYAEDTQEAESKAIWLKVRDTIKTAFDAEKFQAYIDRLNGLTKKKLEKPEAAIDNVVKEYELSEERKAKILENLFSSGDRTQFGLVQAVTAVAHSLEKDNPEEASRLEGIGGKLVALSENKLDKLVAAV